MIMTVRTRSILAVYLSGLLQGIALILFPSAGTLFTDGDFHGLSDSQFGILFTPQIIAAIIASSLAPRLAARYQMKWVLRGGLLANIGAMAGMAASAAVIDDNSLSFACLLVGTGLVGAGFGLTVTALNAYAFDLFRQQADAAITGLHVLTGVGQVGAALTLGLFVGLGAWWLAPLSVAGAVLLMILFQLPLPLQLSQQDAAPTASDSRAAIPARIWLYALIVFFYGACEATFGNWSPIYLEDEAGLSKAEAGLALSIFWGTVTLGRVLFALLALRFNPQRPLYRLAPFIVAGVFFLLPSVSGILPNYLLLGLAGLGLSFYFPLSISLASAERPDLAATTSGMTVAAIMLGTGISSNIVGFTSAEMGLSLIFRLSALYALGMGGLALYLTLKPQEAKIA